MDSKNPTPWWQGVADETAKRQAFAQARLLGLQLADDANRQPGGVAAMSLESAEDFANELDNTNADLEYVEAAVTGDTTIAGSSSQASNQASVTEQRAQFQTNLKAIQTKAKRKKITANVKAAQDMRNAVESAEGDKAGEVRTVRFTQEHEPTIAREHAPASKDNQASESILESQGILATDPMPQNEPTASEPVPTSKQTLKTRPTQARSITPVNESNDKPKIEAVLATKVVSAIEAKPADTTTPVIESATTSEPAPASQDTLLKEATPVDKSTIIEPTLEFKGTAATESLPASKPHSISASTPANKTAAGKISSATTAPPANEPSLASQPTPTKKVTSADDPTTSEAIQVTKSTAATEPLLSTEAQPVSVPKAKKTVADKITSAASHSLATESQPSSGSTTVKTTASKANEALPSSEAQPSSGPITSKKTTASKATEALLSSQAQPFSGPTTSEKTTASKATESLPSSEAQPSSGPTTSKKTTASKATETLPSGEAQPTSEPSTAKKTTAGKANDTLPSSAAQPASGHTTVKKTTAGKANEALTSSEAQPTSLPTTGKTSTPTKIVPAATYPPVTEPLPSSEAQPTSGRATAKKTTASKGTPATTASPVTEPPQASEAQPTSLPPTAEKITASKPATTASPVIEPVHTSEPRLISGPTLAESTSTTSITPATTSTSAAELVTAIEPSISPKPSGGRLEEIPEEPLPTRGSLNRRARADSVKFIRSRTNSRSGANTPQIGPIRNIIQSEVAGHLPSPVEIDENPFELDKTPKGPTKEEKGKGVVRDPPVEIPKVSKAQPGPAPLDAYPSPDEAWDFMFGPEPTDEDKSPSSLAAPEQRAVKGSKPTKSPQPHDDLSSTTRPQPSAANTGSNTAGKKKKKKNKKKISHPERLKKYVQAATTSARMLRYEAARSAPLDFRKLIGDSDPSSSSARPGLGDSQGPVRSGPPGSSTVVDPRPSFQSLKWAYATHSPADAELSKHGFFLFEKIPPIKATPLRFPEPYHLLTERPPVIVNHEYLVADAPAVKFTGDPNVPGDTLMHVFPAPNRRPDARSYPGHPDFVSTSLLLQYQAVEATGQTVWRHDRELLDCRHRKCNKKCSDWNQETILCLGCGPKTHIRYCSLNHQLEDLEGHWRECGTDAMLIKKVIDWNTTPPHFARHCPAIPNLHGYNSLDRYLQRAYAMMTAGQYTLFNYEKPTDSIILIWPKTDPNHVEMSARIERILNILLFDHKSIILRHYFWRLIRELMMRTNQWTRNGAMSLGSQFAMEFEDNWTIPKHFGHRGDYLRPLCETDWDGDHWHHAHGSACVKYFGKMRSPSGEVVHMSGRGVKQIVEQYEAKYWVLRAWRQRHECPYWRQRAENTGVVKFPGVKEGREYPHPYLGEGFEGWGAADSDICEEWVPQPPEA